MDTIQISEAVVKLELKKKDIEKLLEKENQLWKEFKESIGDDKFAEYLAKVYKKKIRRSKKKASNRPGMFLIQRCFRNGTLGHKHRGMGAKRLRSAGITVSTIAKWLAVS